MLRVENGGGVCVLFDVKIFLLTIYFALYVFVLVHFQFSYDFRMRWIINFLDHIILSYTLRQRTMRYHFLGFVDSE